MTYIETLAKGLGQLAFAWLLLAPLATTSHAATRQQIPGDLREQRQHKRCPSATPPPATRFDRRVQAEQLHRAEGTRRRRKLEHERRYPAEGMARQLGARWLFPVRPRNIGMAAAATNLTMPTVTLPPP